MNSYIALKTFTNDAIFEEVVHRLKRLYIEKSGKEFLFGEIAFVFHDGRFQGIEERSKLRIFRNPPTKPVAMLETATLVTAR